MKFTIFTSCYNQANYLSQAIESVLNQTYTDFEYLLYDDGSTDNTWEIIQSYAAKDPRIKAARLYKQGNVACVINRSIRDMSTDFWLWCPSDDMWAENLLELKCEHVKKKPESIVCANSIYIDQNGNQLRKRILTQHTREGIIEKIKRGDCPIGFSGILIPKILFEKVGVFPEYLDFSEDFAWLCMAVDHEIEFVYEEEFLVYIRKHNNRLSYRNKDNLNNRALRVLNDIINNYPRCSRLER